MSGYRPKAGRHPAVQPPLNPPNQGSGGLNAMREHPRAVRAMTNLPPREEWDALPEVGFGRRQEIINGEVVWVPFMEYESAWIEEHKPRVWTDAKGCRWRFAQTLDGRWAKHRLY